MTDQTDKLLKLNGELCAEVNAKDARIRELESLVRDMWRTLSAMYQLNLGIDIGKEHDYEQRIAALGMEVDG